MFAALLLAACPLAQSVTITPVAESGESAPGTTEDFSSFSNGMPVGTSLTGGLSFGGFIEGFAGTNEGIWARIGGNLVQVVQEGDTAPGASGAFGAGPSQWLFAGPVNDTGETAFGGRVGVDSGIWFMDASGILSKVALTGDAAPGTSGLTFTALSHFPGLAHDGRVGFSGGAGTGSSTAALGIWVRQAGGSVELLAISGGAAPQGLEYTSSGIGDPWGAPAWSTQGHVAYRATLLVGSGSPPSVTSSNDRVVVAGDTAAGAAGSGMPCGKATSPTVLPGSRFPSSTSPR